MTVVIHFANKKKSFSKDEAPRLVYEMQTETLIIVEDNTAIGKVP